MTLVYGYHYENVEGFDEWDCEFGPYCGPSEESDTDMGV